MTQVLAGKGILSLYLDYARETIEGRVLTRVEDGLKPVHRRVLYSMYKLGLHGNSQHKKCARIIGDTIGKYHPHGDQSTYETLVKLAQPFSSRYCLIDGQGNFGSSDDSSFAAMRYTEARLSRFAERVFFEDFKERDLQFKENFDGSEKEPVVIPAKIPVDLVNGTMGVAVGLTSKIPPHNLSGVCEALEMFISQKDVSNRDIVNVLGAPDYAGGGVIFNDIDDLEKIYSRGSGVLRVRSDYEILDTHNGWVLQINNFPPSVDKEVVTHFLKRISSSQKGKDESQSKDYAIKTKILDLIDDIYFDENSKEAVKLIITPKNPSIGKDLFVAEVFSIFPLVENISFRLRYIGRDGRPTMSSLGGYLGEWLDARRDFLIRSNKNLAQEIEQKIHILEGREIVINSIHRVVDIVMEGVSPAADLKREFSLSKLQVEDILSMTIGSLRKLEVAKVAENIIKLKSDLSDTIDTYEDVRRIDKIIIRDLRSIKKDFADERRCRIGRNVINDSIIDCVDIKVQVMKSGWVCVSQGESPDGLEAEETLFSCEATNKDSLCFLCDDGRSYSLNFGRLDLSKPYKNKLGNLFGNHFRVGNIIQISKDADRENVVVTRNGVGFRYPSKALFTKMAGGKQFIELHEGDEIVGREGAKDDQFVVLLSSFPKLLVFPVQDLIRLQSGGVGQRLFKLNGSRIKDFHIVNSDALIYDGGKINGTAKELSSKRNLKGMQVKGELNIVYATDGLSC